MSRTISSPVAALVDDTVTQPGFLVQLEFDSQIVRYSTLGSLDWNGVPWVGANMTVDNLQGDGKRARVTIFDATAGLRTICMTGAGIRNRTVTVWKAYANALASGDPAQVFWGVGDQCAIARGKVSIDCARPNSRVMKAPRLRMAPATGFNFLAPAGTIIEWGAWKITLDSGRRSG